MHDDHPSLSGFENVSLEDGYVLDITVHPGVLTLELDLLLWPGHPGSSSPTRLPCPPICPPHLDPNGTA